MRKQNWGWGGNGDNEELKKRQDGTEKWGNTQRQVTNDSRNC